MPVAPIKKDDYPTRSEYVWYSEGGQIVNYNGTGPIRFSSASQVFLESLNETGSFFRKGSKLFEIRMNFETGKLELKEATASQLVEICDLLFISKVHNPKGKLLPTSPLKQKNDDQVLS